MPTMAPAIAACVALLLAAAPAAAFTIDVPSKKTRGDTRRNPQRVEFAAGETTAVVKGEVQGDGSTYYALHANEGRQLSVALTADDPSLVLDVYDDASLELPGGKHEAAQQPRDVRQWSGTLDKPAEYIIQVHLSGERAGRKAGYSLRISLTGRDDHAKLAGEARTVAYSCVKGKELSVQFVPGAAPMANVAFEGKTFALPLVPGASGSQYAKDTTIFWAKDDEATFESPDWNGTCLVKVAAGSADLTTSDWDLDGLSHQRKTLPVPHNAKVNASFRDGTLSGTGGCNRYSASYTMTGGAIEIGPVRSTRTLCNDIDFETAFFAALAKVDKFSVGKSGLLLSGPETTLRFVARARAQKK